MAMIKCPECGKEISDKVIICPSCGVQISSVYGKMKITREYSDYLQNYSFFVDIDGGNQCFDISMDESFDVLLPYGIHTISVYYHKSLVCSRTIEMKEDYYFTFTIGPENNIIILENNGLSRKRKRIDIGKQNSNKLVCPRCHNQNVNVQMVTEQMLVRKKHGFLYWACGGWLLSLIIWIIKWFYFTGFAILFKLFGIGGKKRQIANKHKSMAVCQTCGYNWEIK